MFICSECKNTIGPKVKPVFVPAGFRNVEYTNTVIDTDELGREHQRIVESRGTELLGERTLCPTDAKTLGIEAISGPVSRTERWGRVFREKEADPMLTPLVITAAANALKRYEHGTKRSVRDANLAIPLIKAFADTNKSIDLSHAVSQ